MHPREKPVTNYLEQQAQLKYEKRQQKAHEANRQNTGAMNLAAIQREAPEAA